MDPGVVSTISLVMNLVIMIVIVIGVLYRFRPKVHIPIMVSCFVLDISNVLVIELNRAAIATSIKTFSEFGSWLLKFHIAISLACCLCYVIAVLTGIRLYKKNVGRRTHKTNAVVFLVCRVLNCITAFMV